MVAIVLIGLPIIEYVGIKLEHGALTMRYALALILGVSIAASYTIRFLGRWAVVPATIAMVVLMLGQEVFSGRTNPAPPARFMSRQIPSRSWRLRLATRIFPLLCPTEKLTRHSPITRRPNGGGGSWVWWTPRAP